MFINPSVRTYSHICAEYYSFQGPNVNRQVCDPLRLAIVKGKDL